MSKEIVDGNSNEENGSLEEGKGPISSNQMILHEGDLVRVRMTSGDIMDGTIEKIRGGLVILKGIPYHYKPSKLEKLQSPG